MKVRIYTTPTCPYCEMAKQYFKMKNIDYEEVDVSSDIEAAREMIEKSGQMGVPVIEIDENIIIGFNKPAIERVLKSQ
ncbi:MAG: glutathione S-transferase N-terminal domain-containing protein [Candidatus Aenigmarchaeota archaeon]|nr:glutathione S-transferase N-terminal domain-containing protein [Candidatus Aenigmarchaeota archaeon]